MVRQKGAGSFCVFYFFPVLDNAARFYETAYLFLAARYSSAEGEALPDGGHSA